MKNIKSKIKSIVENADTKVGRYFDIFFQALIVLSLVSFSIETLPNISDQLRSLLRILEIVVVVFFTVEYLLRLWVADRKLGYVFSFFGLIDLMAILPFYLSTGLDLRGLRSFRLLRLFRTLKLVRYSRAVQRFHRAFLIVREEIYLFMGVTLIILWLAATGMYYFENAAQPEKFSSVFASLWWAIATLTTVGFGDIYPVTNGGKIFTFIILLIGLGVIAVPAALFATALGKARLEEDKLSVD